MEPDCDEEEELDYTAVAACNYYQMLEQSTISGRLSERELIDNILALSERRPALRLAKKRGG